MDRQITDWHITPPVSPPDWFKALVRPYGHQTPLAVAAQLLWQRGIRDRAQLQSFLTPNSYQPTAPLALGPEMEQAVTRVHQAYQAQEKVAIWGDFDADGVTATALLWQGLGQWFSPDSQLTYSIPDRTQDGHGLSRQGLDRLAQQGYTLIITCDITCDTDSTNSTEITYGATWGLEFIIIDHHSLPHQRPPVVALVNPRQLAPDHPLAHLPSVAISYKFMEALYGVLGNSQRPKFLLTDLLDLVAIGLLADLVQLQGENRYLAQRGLKKLQELMTPKGRGRRPGVTQLLSLCQSNGDRPTDITFGLGPRINAISRIQGNAHLCVELLTSGDANRCRHLAQQAELFNTRRKALQRSLYDQVSQKLTDMDLSTTTVIVVAESGWPVGILGLVASQIAQTYGKPTLLLSIDPVPTEAGELAPAPLAAPLARGAARSCHGIDLYPLFQSQPHLIHKFGGHPLAPELVLSAENIPLLTEALDRQLRQQLAKDLAKPNLTVDLVVTVADLTLALFREIKLLDPYGGGNPVPRLLIQNCWFDQIVHRNLKDRQGYRVRYIQTRFELWDPSVTTAVPGVWWDHYGDEIPQGRCDAVIELEFNPSRGAQGQLEVRLIAVRSCGCGLDSNRLDSNRLEQSLPQLQGMLDWRSGTAVVSDETELDHPDALPDALVLDYCPRRWQEIQRAFQQAQQQQQSLALAYSQPSIVPPPQRWQHLIGAAKYLARTGEIVTLSQLAHHVAISNQVLQVGLIALSTLGFEILRLNSDQIQIQERVASPVAIDPVLGSTQTLPWLQQFLGMVEEEQFQQNYFARVSLGQIKAMIMTSEPLVEQPKI